MQHQSMVPPFFNVDLLLPSVQAGCLILTPNFRLARHINNACGQYFIDQGIKTWHQPQVQALEGWLSNCWAELVDAPYPPLLAQPCSVINNHSEQLLWRSSIAKDTLLPPGADIPSLAELAMQTLQQLHRYRVPFNELNDTHHPGSESFLRWFSLFTQALKEKNLFTWEQAQGYIEKAFKEKFLTAYPGVRLVGFHTLPLLHHDIINAASNDVDFYKPTVARGNTNLRTCLTDQSEITAAAQWAKKQYDTNPRQRIGVVFANLANTQQQIFRIFNETFVPKYCLPKNERGIPPFNFSAGGPLGNSPILKSAFGLLAVQTQALSLENLCQLLHDPFWDIGHGSAEQTVVDQPINLATNKRLIARAHCEVLLRDSNKLMHTPLGFRASLAEAEKQTGALTNVNDNSNEPFSHSGQSSPLTSTWQAIAERVRRQPKTARFCYWADEFGLRLNLLGWPGPRTLDSIEYQQHQHWLSLLDEFAALDTSAEPLDATMALTQLARMAQATIFQAQTDDSQIQILGLLEAAGLEFDQLWIAGVDDKQWPQATSLNPLLPVPLQQRHQLPRSSASHELTLAKGLLEDFEHSSQHIVFSYAIRDGDSEREASRLLPATIFITPAIAANLHHPLLAVLPATKLQKIKVAKAPALQPGDQPIRGGSAILQTQAGNPFNAFAIWRLGARPLAQPSSGLSAIERGNLVHKCLELFWTQFKNQADLKALNSTALNTAIEDVITEAMRPLQHSRSDIFGPRFSAIEAQRLKQLLQQWLDIELQRSPFSVLAPEKQLFMSIGGLPLNLRIDRIDRLDDQRVVLIDYKTGDTNIHCWAGERLEEPQLPLYALALPEQIGALCFGQISANKSVAVKGVSNTPEIIPGLQPLEKINFERWEDSIQVWREQLETLAEEFLEGHAEMAFYTRNALRYQTHLHPLNRWPEICQRENTTITLDEHDS